MKVADLTGALLDYWVARAEGIEHGPLLCEMRPGRVFVQGRCDNGIGFCTAYSPSTNVLQAWPIFDREGVGIVKFYPPIDGEPAPGHEWVGLSLDDSVRMNGPDGLVAGLRCFVAMRFGETVPDVDGTGSRVTA
jgi:hypothetical protein